MQIMFNVRFRATCTKGEDVAIRIWDSLHLPAAAFIFVVRVKHQGGLFLKISPCLADVKVHRSTSVLFGRGRKRFWNTK